jgi:hypothetical protein
MQSGKVAAEPPDFDGSNALRPLHCDAERLGRHAHAAVRRFDGSTPRRGNDQILSARIHLQETPPRLRCRAVAQQTGGNRVCAAGWRSVRRAAGAPSVRSAATTRQLLCRSGEPMVHCLRRVTPYRLWITPDRADCSRSGGPGGAPTEKVITHKINDIRIV